MRLWLLMGMVCAMLVMHVPGAHAVSYGGITTQGCNVLYSVTCDPSPISVQPATCKVGSPDGGTAGGATEVVGTQIRLASRMFSSAVCQVETITGEMVGELWCSISAQVAAPLASLLVLYVIIFAISFTIGLEQLSVGEVAKRLIKILLIWVFATQSQYALGIMYQFYIWALKDGIGIVLSSGEGSKSAVHILHNIDQLATQVFYTQECSMTGRAVTVIFGVGALVAMPGGFIIGPALIAQGLMTFFVFVRTIITYLVSIIFLVFFLSLGPIYLCFALFKSTQQVFNSWLGHLTSYALQPVIIFAYLAMIEAYMPNLADSLSLPGILDQTVSSEGTAGLNSSSITAALPTWCQQFTGGGVCQKLLSPDYNFAENLGDWITLFTNLGALTLLNYATVQFLDTVPHIAKLLASGGTKTLTLGGGAAASRYAVDGGAVNARGMDGSIQAVTDAMGRANQDGADIEGVMAAGSQGFFGHVTQSMDPRIGSQTGTLGIRDTQSGSTWKLK